MGITDPKTGYPAQMKPWRMVGLMSLDWMSERDFMRLIKIVAQVWGKHSGPIIDGLVRIREHR